MTALTTQVGGTHYKDAKIQPIQYIEANGLGFLEGCVLKRVTRHDKPTGKGRQDIEKAIHELQLLLEFRYPVAAVEPASEIDDESPRAQAIGQNGNDGAAYELYGKSPFRGANCVVESRVSEGLQYARLDDLGVFWSERGRKFNNGKWKLSRMIK